jgi:hypothetical protein
MGNIVYAAERITIDAEHLRAWSAVKTGAVISLVGRCPRCGHDAPNQVPLRAVALESSSLGERTLTASLACTCVQPHPQRPVEMQRGCGRTWSVMVTNGDDGTLRLSALTSPALVEAAEALRQAALWQLSDLRSAGEKWIAGITAFYGLLGFAGFTAARGTIVQLGTGWQIGVAVAALAAIGLAALAIYWAYRAAYGWPKVRYVRNDEELLSWYADQLAAPGRSAVMLCAGVRRAGASLGALVVLVGLLWFAPTQSPGVPMIRTTLRDGSVLCGTVLASAQSNALSMRQFSGSTVISIPFSQIDGLTSVSSC